MNSSGSTTQIGAVGLRLVARGARLGGIAGDVADGRVQLGQRNCELRFAHTRDGALHKQQTAIGSL